MKKKMGRPVKSKADAKSVLLQIRLTAAEKSHFGAAARLADLKLSEWVRERLRQSADEEIGGTDEAESAG